MSPVVVNSPYFTHKLYYNDKPIKECTKEELIDALAEAAKEIINLNELYEKQVHLLEFTLSMWESKEKK